MGGADKGLVAVAGRPMIEHVLMAVESQAGEVAINANRSTSRYARYGHRVLPDRLDGFQGPLAGMASGLESATTELVLVVPCDSPLVDPTLGPRLYAALSAHAADIAVAHDGERLHPVFALLRRTVAAGLRDFLGRGERKIDRWLEGEETTVVDFSDLPDMFLNVNRESDWLRLEARLGNGRPDDAPSPASTPVPVPVPPDSGRRRIRAGSAAGGSGVVSRPREGGTEPAPGGGARRIRPPVVGLAGYSGSGKTTLATGVVRALAAAGFRVAAVKHAHHSFDIDRPGKDSYELRRAGAAQTLIGSRRRWALVAETATAREPSLDELVDRLDRETIDLVLVEGFKHAPFPKIAVGRGGETPPLVNDPFVVAVATPGAAGGPAPGGRTLPRIDLDRPDHVARFIIDRFLTPSRLPSMQSPLAAIDPSCMDDFDPSSLLVEQALERIRALTAPVAGAERVAIRESLGRVLAEPVRSPIDVPAHDNSAMDGYAVRAIDAAGDGPTTLRVVGTAWAGRPFRGTVEPGECVRIMTGAVMPAGSDSVVIQERTATGPDDTVRFGEHPKAGSNVRTAGEDIRRGTTVLAAGQRIGPAELGVLASLGTLEASVRRRVRVAFFSTGDELRSLGEALDAGGVYDSNRYTLLAMLRALGAETLDLGVVRDTREDVERAFREAAETADAIVTSGGVSVGEADFVKETLERIGAVDFWKIAMKPGRPLAFGTVGEALFFGLPGNPVSVMVTFYQFVQPALRRMMGETVSAPVRFRVKCGSRLRKRPGRVEFQRGMLARDEAGQLTVRSTGGQGSGILSSMHEADCFIVLPLESEGVEPGEPVEVEPFHGVTGGAR